MSEDFSCPLCYEGWGHAPGCPNEALEAVGEYDPYSVSRPTRRTPDLGKRPAKKRVSKSKKSTVKKAGSRPAPSG